MAAKTAKKTEFKEILIAKVDEYMDQAFNTDDPNKRQKLREAIQQMEKLLLTVSSIE